MKSLIATFALGAAALFAAPAAQALTPIFMEYEGIKGVAASATPFGGTLQLWGWRQPFTPGSVTATWPAFAGGVNVAVGDLDGDGLVSRLTLSAIEAFAGGQVFFDYELQNVLVTSYTVHTSAGGGSFEMPSFTSATMRWRPLLPNGGRGDFIQGHWDLVNGTFSGDMGVLGALDEMGAQRWPDGSLTITAVPEPASTWLMLLGAAAMALRLGARRRAGGGMTTFSPASPHAARA